MFILYLADTRSKCCCLEYLEGTCYHLLSQFDLLVMYRKQFILIGSRRLLNAIYYNVDSKYNTLRGYVLIFGLCAQNAHGVLVPGGFGDRGIQGKILAATFARTNRVPYLGICLGMQLAVVEFARNVSNTTCNVGEVTVMCSLFEFFATSLFIYHYPDTLECMHVIYNIAPQMWFGLLTSVSGQ